MATRGARRNFLIWRCSVRGWGYTDEEIFEKKKLIKRGEGLEIVLAASAWQRLLGGLNASRLSATDNMMQPPRTIGSELVLIA